MVVARKDMRMHRGPGRHDLLHCALGPRRFGTPDESVLLDHSTHSLRTRRMQRYWKFRLSRSNVFLLDSSVSGHCSISTRSLQCVGPAGRSAFGNRVVRRLMIQWIQRRSTRRTHHAQEAVLSYLTDASLFN